MRNCGANIDITLGIGYIIGMKKKLINALLAEGEGQRVEFKETLNRLDREITAFANATGGSLFIGVKDSGEVIGTNISNKRISEIQDIAQNCDPPIKINITTHENSIIEITVFEGIDKPYKCKGGFFIRIGPNTQKLKRNEIRDIILSESTYHFDELIQEKFIYPKDFDKNKLDEFLKLANVSIKASPEDILQSLDLAERKNKELKLNNTAILFFAKNPQRFLKESYLSCVRYQGMDKYTIIDRQEINGDLFSLIENAFKFIKRNIRVENKVDLNTRHELIYEYPLVAIREAVINAVMHRDYYYDLSHIYIHIYSNRIEIENPGGLPGGIDINKLGTRSVRRNRTIADILYRAGYIERVGSGFQRIQKALQENGNPSFEIYSSNYFMIRLFPRIQKELKVQLTDRQHKLYQLITEKKQVTKQEVYTHFGFSGDTALRELKRLCELNLVDRIGIGKSTVYQIPG